VSGADEAGVDIWTDGACKGNPGPGGWGALLRWGDHERELFGGEKLTTNNRMELTAVIEGLRALSRPVPVAGQEPSMALRPCTNGAAYPAEYLNCIEKGRQL
jgi:ribonuclease HI